MADALFTPEQANAALPLVRAIVVDVVDLERRVVEATHAYRDLKADPGKPQAALNEARGRLAELVAERDECQSELADVGVRLGDALRGICDFPAELDGEPVFLCWEIGEASVEHFHARDEGFAGRRPLPVPVGTS